MTHAVAGFSGGGTGGFRGDPSTVAGSPSLGGGGAFAPRTTRSKGTATASSANAGTENHSASVVPGAVATTLVSEPVITSAMRYSPRPSDVASLLPGEGQGDFWRETRTPGNGVPSESRTVPIRTGPWRRRMRTCRTSPETSGFAKFPSHRTMGGEASTRPPSCSATVAVRNPFASTFGRTFVPDRTPSAARPSAPVSAETVLDAGRSGGAGDGRFPRSWVTSAPGIGESVCASITVTSIFASSSRTARNGSESDGTEAKSTGRCPAADTRTAVRPRRSENPGISNLPASSVVATTRAATPPPAASPTSTCAFGIPFPSPSTTTPRKTTAFDSARRTVAVNTLRSNSTRSIAVRQPSRSARTATSPVGSPSNVNAPSASVSADASGPGHGGGVG